MASDATVPDTAPADLPEDDGSIMPSDSRQRARRRRGRQRTSLLATISTELSAMLFMLALGMWVALILMSACFPFGGTVGDMQFAGIAITVLAAIVVVLLVPAAARFWAAGDRSGSIMAIVLTAAMIGNWLGWFSRFNLPRTVMQFFS